MGPFSGARWARSQSAPPCPGAWSYRILGRFLLPAASVESQQQQQEQQVAVPQAGWPRPNGGIGQPHPPGCCVHPQYGHLNAPPAIPPVPVDLLHNSPIGSGHHIPANTNYAVQSPYHQPGYPPQYPVRDHAHVHPTPHGTHHQPPSLHPQVHSHCVYPAPPPPGEQLSVSQTNLVGAPPKPGFVHSHLYSGCQYSHPQNGTIHNLHDPRPHPPQQQHHGHPQGVPPLGLPQGPTWNAVNSQRAGSGSTAPPHAQSTINAPPEVQGTFERPYIIPSPAEGTNMIRTSPGRPHSHSALGTSTVGTSSHQAQESRVLPSPSNSSDPSLQLKQQATPHLNINGTNASSTTKNLNLAPKRTRKSYTREYKLKALNLLNGERPDGKGGMVPASDTCKLDLSTWVCHGYLVISCPGIVIL